MTDNVMYPDLSSASLQAFVNDVGVIFDGIMAIGIVWWTETDLGPQRHIRFWRWKFGPPTTDTRGSRKGGRQ